MGLARVALSGERGFVIEAKHRSAGRQAVYRRRGTVVGAWIGIVVQAGIGIAMVPAVWSDGLVSALVMPAFSATAIIFSLMVGVWPRLVVTDEGVIVHNELRRFVIPYGQVAAVGRTGGGRLGLTTTTGRQILVAGYSGSLIASWTGDRSAGNAVTDIRDRWRAHAGSTGHPPPVRVFWQTGPLIAFGVSLALLVTLIQLP
ncbi:hypothetical protein R8Z50_20035 [Longispora sp. K20-0274]|uniref:PH domain-containing protein n=1 Tax=Longispora sp. K20-0274 TaxID=3088255 RepID=UPI00399BBBD8